MRERISSNVPRMLAIEVKKKAEELEISVSAFIEIALESELGNIDTNELRKARRKSEKRVCELQAECDDLSRELKMAKSQIIRVADELCVPVTAHHILGRIGEIEDNAKSKIDLLLNRSWWSRLRNKVPWR